MKNSEVNSPVMFTADRDSGKTNSNINIMRECEEFLINKIEKYETVVMYDMNSPEQPFFSILNYTSLGEMLYIHPLSPEASYFQMESCFIDREPIETDYFEYFKEKYSSGYMNKYENQKERSINEFDAVVVLPGQNKLFNTVCINKLRYIVHEHGHRAVFKFHPLTREENQENFISLLPGNACFVDCNENVYDYIKDADIVYTNHNSDSVFASSCLEKTISPIDSFQMKVHGTFAAINHFLFYHTNRKEIINMILNNYRGGLFVPNLNNDWRVRIDKYLEHIHEKRDTFKKYYIENIGE